MIDVAAVAVPVNGPGALAFVHQGELIWLGLQLVPVALALALLLTGAGARVRAALGRLCGGRRYGTIVLVGWAWLVAAGLLSLPLQYLDHVRWSVWGVPTPPVTAWLAGQAAQLGVLLVAAMLLLWIPFALIAKAPRVWPVWLTLIVVPVLTVGLVCVQVWVQPMLTSYQPLADRALAAQIQSMADRCGAGRIPVLIGGDDETVVGLGPTSRILLSPEALKVETRAELITTVAHELKHYRMGDNWLAIGTVGALILAGALLVQVLGGGAVRAWGARFGFSTLADPTSLPLIALILTIAWVCAGLPIYNAVQRHAELEADRFALEVTHDNHALAQRQAEAGKYPWRMNEYDEAYRLLFANHPSQAERVRLANSYRPWEQGRPGVYDGICKPRARTGGADGA